MTEYHCAEKPVIEGSQALGYGWIQISSATSNGLKLISSVHGQLDLMHTFDVHIRQQRERPSHA